MDNQLISLIPKNKHDLEPISQLMVINEDEIKPILPELLYWIADMNWPVAQEMINVLIRFPNVVAPLIKEVLNPSETDGEWKYFIITNLLPRLPTITQKLLLEDVKRIQSNPTDSEKYSALEAAEIYIESLTH